MKTSTSQGPSFGIFVAIGIAIFMLTTPEGQAALAGATAPSPGQSVSSTSAAPSSPGQAKPGEPAAPAGDYDRDRFGQAWSDNVNVAGGHNGCDTRNDILAAQMTDVTFKPGTRNCVVMSGTLNDPYSGKTIKFVKAEASKVQIDHVFALSLAWELGASGWTDERRRDFANDPDNLVATSGAVNASKSDRSPAEWSPATKQGRCLFATRFTTVAAKYALSVPGPDRAALAAMLRDC